MRLLPLRFWPFSQALKRIEPAIVGAIEISVGPPLALLIGYFAYSARPDRMQRIVCIGILLGCVMLSVAAYTGSGLTGGGSQAGLGVVASLVAGTGAVASKALMERGWSRGAVLAHRFY